MPLDSVTAEIASKSASVLYSDVLPKSAEYGGLVFFLMVMLIASMACNVLFFIRLLRMMDKIVGFGDRTNVAVQALTEVKKDGSA